jgi:putative spermidine/putrescine transport system substrate-binding protein
MILRSLTCAILILAVPAGASAAQTPQAVRISFFVFLGADQGVVPREVAGRYMAAHPGVTVDVVESSNAVVVPMMVAARHAAPDAPPVHCGFFNVEAMNRGDLEDLWEPLDDALVPRLGTVMARFRRPADRGVPYMMTTIGILYNRDRVAEPPASWSVLWNPSSRGRVALLDYPLFLVALAARLAGGSEADPGRGFEILSENAGNIRALVESADALKNALVSGDATYAPWFYSVAKVWITGGAPLAFAVPSEGLVAYPYHLAIVKGVTPGQRAVCGDLIDALLDPDVAARHAALTFSIPLVEGVSLSDPADDPLLDLAGAEHSIVLDYAAISRASAEWRRRWDREVRRNLD